MVYSTADLISISLDCIFFLQVLVDDIKTREVKRLELLLLGGVGDLAVVDNDGPAVAALAVVDGPAKALGELEVGVGGEDL
jgi:hypothetical protein